MVSGHFRIRYGARRRLKSKDMFTVADRSRIMRAVRSRGTDPEERLAATLNALGLRFRRHDSKLPGTPDFVFVLHRVAVFVDGDFWHGRAWFARGEAPVGNREFWIRKFEMNRRRDRRVDRALRRLGWGVVHLWGSDIRRAPDRAAARIAHRLCGAKKRPQGLTKKPPAKSFRP